KTLRMLHHVLSRIGPPDQAKAALSDALFFAMKRLDTLDRVTISARGSRHGGDLEKFFKCLMSEVHEGETAALAAGTLLTILAEDLRHKVSVTVHPVNQSGSSSREVSDVDARADDILVWTAEVKDKSVTRHDVQHAVGKVAAVGHDRLMFLM